MLPQKPKRIWIENVLPQIDCGLHPIKRCIGEKVKVTADIFMDGHDKISALLLYRPSTCENWHEIPMKAVGGDVYAAEFPILELVPHFYTIEAWIDRFSTWKEDLKKKYEAGQDVEIDLLEGAEIIEKASKQAEGADKAWLMERAKFLFSGKTQEERVTSALAQDLHALISHYPDRFNSIIYDKILAVNVDRLRAKYGAWYELFPRSFTTDPEKPGTFKDALKKLPEIASMGFDVVYLPPIHPIGKINRKGKNNSLEAGPEDPGSPWAIGSDEGGHKSMHLDLGTFEDFEEFLEKASKFGLEVALDIAFQCAPDHPYVKEHPEWFIKRPDGSIKYAENPPKKYEDVLPLNFESEDWPHLWEELKSIVTFWIEKGIKIFRVDNPHTKPLDFWKWLISEIRTEHPDIILLSEAFTRPKVMYALAKAGFNQSYTYFTWRNTKQEIIQYMDELTRRRVKEYFRPNFFANTPDILPEFLQFGGRPAFLIRLVLAATLGPSYGIYSGFELCEAEAVKGTEEYLNSEKYEIKTRDWNKTGNVKDYISTINRIRRENPAFSSNDGLRFYEVDNDYLIFYGKTSEDKSNIILVVVNLDPFSVQEGWLNVPVEEFGLGPTDVYQVHDLIGEGRFFWQGEKNYVRLDPSSSPAHIFKIRRKFKTEKDFDYFM